MPTAGCPPTVRLTGERPLHQESTRDRPQDIERDPQQIGRHMKAIVTAAASGIDLAIARELANNGASVFIGDLDGGALSAVITGDDRISGTVADVSAHDQVPEFIKEAVAELGGVDVLVNNVGIAGPTVLVEDTDFAGWDLTMQVNLGSHFYCSHEVIPHLKAQRSGAIINISSIAGQYGYPFHSAYAVSKAAVIAFTKTLAMELGPYNIRANAVCPCAVAGPRTDSVMQVEADTLGLPFETVKEAYRNQNSMRTFIDAEEIENRETHRLEREHVECRWRIQKDLAALVENALRQIVAILKEAGRARQRVVTGDVVVATHRADVVGEA
jgi:NAD(P)-dependent dehydrogenase (short-subunit alcohol dehydrogenase family)